MMTEVRDRWHGGAGGAVLLGLLAAVLNGPAHAAEWLCATVKIEINQELTLVMMVAAGLVI